MDYIIDEKKLKEWYRHYGPLASTMTFDQQVDMFLMDYPTVEVLAEGVLDFIDGIDELCIKDNTNETFTVFDIFNKEKYQGKPVKILLEGK